MTSPPPPAPMAGPDYDFTPAAACRTVTPNALTVAIVAPLWQAPGAAAPLSQEQVQAVLREPKIVWDVAPAMREDFLELLSCRGFLTKGPFDSFDVMVFPDREGSNLLLEPDLQLDVDIPEISLVSPSGLAAVLRVKTAKAKLGGTATVGGRVNLSLKEPVTNTRMWARSIEIPSESFTFTTDDEYPSQISEYQAKLCALDDSGLRRDLQPRLERIYQTILSTAESYLDPKELALVASQAKQVRAKASIGVPR